MGFLEFLAAGAAPEAAAADEYPNDAMRWSDPHTWGGNLPAQRRSGHVDVGRTLIIDQDVDVGSLHIKGTAIVERRDISIGAEWILVEGAGALIAGSAEQPFKQRLHITLCSSASEQSCICASAAWAASFWRRSMAERSICMAKRAPHGCRWATAPRPATTRCAWRSRSTGAPASALRSLRAPTIACSKNERSTMSAPIALRFAWQQPVWHRHHGKHAPLRHVLPGSIGKVVLLSRNIVIEGCADSERNSVGAYCMIAGTADNPARHSIGRFSGVEFRRMGQFNRPGRYPLHWHDNGDAADSSVIGCLIHQSYQRGIVTVGSRHVRISGNVVMKPYGHGYIVESEDNSPQLVTTNLALRPRVVRFADQKMRSYCEHRPRAFWIVQSAAARTTGSLDSSYSRARPYHSARAAAGAACRRRTN